MNEITRTAGELSRTQVYTLDEMVQRMGEHVNRILRENLYELRLNERQLHRLERQKKELREHLLRCGVGDALAKSYVLEFMQESLLRLFCLNENNIDRTFYFRDSAQNNPEYLFDRLLYLYKKEYGQAAMSHLIEDNRLLSGDRQARQTVIIRRKNGAFDMESIQRLQRAGNHRRTAGHVYRRRIGRRVGSGGRPSQRVDLLSWAQCAPVFSGFSDRQGIRADLPQYLSL